MDDLIGRRVRVTDANRLHYETYVLDKFRFVDDRPLLGASGVIVEKSLRMGSSAYLVVFDEPIFVAQDAPWRGYGKHNGRDVYVPLSCLEFENGIEEIYRKALER